jgi:hypothetical protein
MERDAGLRKVIVAMIAAAIAFCVVGVGIFYKVVDVRAVGWRFSGPTALAGEMGALCGGGLAAVVVLIVGLRWGGRR